MITAKLNINKTEISLTGSKEDVLYILKHTTSELISNNEVNIKFDIKKVKSSLYTKEQMISMYEYLQKQGNYTIKQFEITRGGKKDPQQYTVCLVFDEDRQRYIFYNPKTEDTFCGTFTTIAALDYYKLDAPGFSLLHTISNKLMKKIHIVDNLTEYLFPEFIPDPNKTMKNSIEKT